MKDLKIAITAAACVIALAGCNAPSIKEEKIASALAPMQAPSLQEGYTRTMSRDGEPYTSQLVRIADGHEHWKVSTGCSYARIDAFAPSAKWSNCEPFADGTHTLTQRTGSPWPLEVGKRWSYAYEGENTNGNTWASTRTCEVMGTTRVEVAGEDHDTYKVVCDDDFSRRTFYVSPDIGGSVRVERWRKNAGETTVFEIRATS